MSSSSSSSSSQQFWWIYQSPDVEWIYPEERDFEMRLRHNYKVREFKFFGWCRKIIPDLRLDERYAFYVNGPRRKYLWWFIKEVVREFLKYDWYFYYKVRERMFRNPLRFQAPSRSTIGITVMSALGLSIGHHYWTVPPNRKIYKARNKIEDEYDRAREDLRYVNEFMWLKLRWAKWRAQQFVIGWFEAPTRRKT